MTAATGRAPLAPGRYILRGGPGGQTVLQRAHRDRYETVNGRRVHHMRSDVYDRWQVLARIRVRAGHHATHYGTLDAAMRVWRLAP